MSTQLIAESITFYMACSLAIASFLFLSTLLILSITHRLVKENGQRAKNFYFRRINYLLRFIHFFIFHGNIFTYTGLIIYVNVRLTIIAEGKETALGVHLFRQLVSF